ncbi:MAG: hypothetical protein VYA55_20520 [Pseudomonadota bacterium]|nr:hypothetical protein [Pseudomonadota bacterium]
MSSWYKQLFRKDKAGSDTLLGISLNPNQALWCLVRQTDQGPQITQTHALEQTFSSPGEALKALCESAPVPTAPAHICLGHQYYNLLLVDAPDVPEAELREAVRWKVKDLITQPLEQVVMDVFRLPADAYRGRMNMSYVAVAERSQVQAVVDVCDQLSVNLRSISINELAMSGLAGQMSELQERGAAFLYLNGQGGTINLIENGSLYLTRTIELGNGGAVFSGNLDFQQDPVDNLALDVQRSLDYYESQIGKSGITALYLVSDAEEQNGWCPGLAERLPIAAQCFELSAGLQPTDGSAVAAGALAPALGVVLAALATAASGGTKAAGMGRVA